MTTHQHTNHGTPGPQPYQALERRLSDRAHQAAWNLAFRAERLHQHWQLTCATVAELRAWLQMAALADGHGRAGHYRSVFCRDADPTWCAGQRSTGRCSIPRGTAAT